MKNIPERSYASDRDTAKFSITQNLYLSLKILV